MDELPWWLLCATYLKKNNKTPENFGMCAWKRQDSEPRLTSFIYYVSVKGFSCFKTIYQTQTYLRASDTLKFEEKQMNN